MPLFEYFCKRCNLFWSELKKPGEQEANCPNCKRLTKKIISKTGKPIIK